MSEKSKSIQEALAEVQRNTEQKKVERLMNEWETLDEVLGLVKGGFGVTGKALQGFMAKKAAQTAVAPAAAAAAPAAAAAAPTGVKAGFKQIGSGIAEVGKASVPALKATGKAAGIAGLGAAAYIGGQALDKKYGISDYLAGKGQKTPPDSTKADKDKTPPAVTTVSKDQSKPPAAAGGAAGGGSVGGAAPRIYSKKVAGGSPSGEGVASRGPFKGMTGSAIERQVSGGEPGSAQEIGRAHV